MSVMILFAHLSNRSPPLDIAPPLQGKDFFPVLSVPISPMSLRPTRDQPYPQKYFSEGSPIQDNIFSGVPPAPLRMPLNSFSRTGEYCCRTEPEYRSVCHYKAGIWLGSVSLSCYKFLFGGIPKICEVLRTDRRLLYVYVNL